MLSGLKISSKPESVFSKVEKELKTYADKFSALAVECEEISYDENYNPKKRINLLDRCKKLLQDVEKLYDKLPKTVDEPLIARKDALSQKITILKRRLSKMSVVVSSEKVDKESVRMARECGEISDESEDGDEEQDTDDENDQERSISNQNDASKKEIGEAKSASFNEDDEDEHDDDDDEEDEEEDEEEDDDDDEDEATEEGKNERNADKHNSLDEASTSMIVMHKALCDFSGEQDGDLSFQTGDLLHVLDSSRNDGWWLAEDQHGRKGLIPSTFLKVYSDDQDDDKELEIEDQQHSEDVDAVSVGDSKKGSMLWSSVRNAVRETSATDVLAALGALPSGFRHSTLGRTLSEDVGHQFAYKSYVSPKLCKSGLRFRDLYWDANTSQIRARISRILRIMTLVRCTNIPLPGTGVDVSSRHVRLCLFDGVNIRSNIINIRAKWDARTPRTWTFTSKVPLNVSMIEEAECFVRTNDTDSNIGMLFELCVSYIRPSTGEKGEFSCGWVYMRLLDDSGLPIPNRNREMFVNGGTPYEKGIEVDPSVSRREASSSIRTMISRNRQPRFIIKVYTPSKEQKEQLDFLPDVLIGNMQLLPFFSLYRQLLADALLRDRVRAESSELIHAPALASFPSAVDQPDLMDGLRIAWMERQRSEKRSNKRDRDLRKQSFRQVYMETVYILLCHFTSLPEYVFCDKEVEQKRHQIIEEFINKWKDRGILAILLAAADTNHKPFSIEELSLDIVRTDAIAVSRI